MFQAFSKQQISFTFVFLKRFVTQPKSIEPFKSINLSSTAYTAQIQ